LGQYIADYAKNYFSTCHEEAAKQLYKTLLEHIKNSNVNNKEEIAAILDQQKGSIEKILGQNIRQFGESEDPKIMNLWPIFTRYAEAMVAKVFAEISKTIRQIEIDNPDFMVDIAITMLKDTAEYFEIVNHVTAAAGEEHGYRVNPATMIASFGIKLHDGV